MIFSPRGGYYRHALIPGLSMIGLRAAGRASMPPAVRVKFLLIPSAAGYQRAATLPPITESNAVALFDAVYMPISVSCRAGHQYFLLLSPYFLAASRAGPTNFITASLCAAYRGD